MKPRAKEGRYFAILGVAILSLVTGVLVAGCSSSSAGEAADGGGGPAAGEILSGIAVPRSDASLVASIEADLGVTFDVIRVFRRWDESLPDPDVEALIASGHRLHLSVRPRTSNGRVILWSDLAEAQPGMPLYGELIAWIDEFVALPPGTYVTLNHEPETRDSADNGTAADYVAVWRRFAELLQERGGDHLRLTWTMTSGALRDQTLADAWYPGDDVVDVIGADTYNWWTCQGTDRPWVDFAELVDPLLDYAQAKGKPLALPEFASADDPADPSRRARWLTDAADYLRSSEAAEIEFVAWFDVTAPGGVYPDCVWDHDVTPASREAFRELVEALD